MKYIGYALLGIGGFILSKNGFGLDTWQWWAISACYIFGVNLFLWKDCYD